MAKPFASSTDLAAKEQTLEVLSKGDPNVGATEGEDFLVCFEALATPVAAAKWLLTAGGVDAATARDGAAAAPDPVRVPPLADIDPGGTPTAALAARPGEVWIVHPDAYIAAHRSAL